MTFGEVSVSNQRKYDIHDKIMADSLTQVGCARHRLFVFRKTDYTAPVSYL